ncbi:MAG: alanyl-tRNA editing protein [Eubacteriales bacterium]
MRTKKLFAEDRYLKECDAIIQDVFQTENEYQTDLILDQTVFFPTGGGQSCDRGYINDFAVINVFEKNGIIHHIIEHDATAKLPIKNSHIHCSIDWNRRFLNMQRHCGEHILSGIFDSECGGVNRGFHMGEHYMTIDISLEKKPEISDITPTMLAHIELLANQVIWNNAPVTIRHFKTKSEAENLPLRKPLTIEQDISVVCVGDIENPSDCVACCGTHPLNAGSVGLIKIYKIEPNKGMFRIYFDAGKNAFQNNVFKHDIITTLCKKYSATEETLIEKIEIQEAKNKTVKNELFFSKMALEELLFDKFNTEYRLRNEKGIICIKNFSIAIGKSEIGNVAKKLSDLTNALFIFYDLATLQLYLISDGNEDCSSFKYAMPQFNAKGGGTVKFASFKFENEKDLLDAIKYLEKRK